MSTDWLHLTHWRWILALDLTQLAPIAESCARISVERPGFLGRTAPTNHVAEAIALFGPHIDTSLPLICTNMVVALAFVAVVRSTFRHAGTGVRTWLPLCMMPLLLSGVFATIVATDSWSDWYPLVPLGLVLLFVLPPRVQTVIMTVLFMWFVLVALHTGVSLGEQALSILIVALAVIVVTVAGIPFHVLRERSRLQKPAGRNHNGLLTRRAEEHEEVIACAVHDLRSGLLGSKNLIAFALPRVAVDPELAVWTLVETGRCLEQTLALMGRLLTTHEAEHCPLQLTNGDLRLSAKAASERNLLLASAAGISFRLDVPDHPVLARYDVTAIARILDNLIANAVRFSPAGGFITLRCRTKIGRAVLTVEDAGPGIPEADWPFLFDKFRRGSNASMHNPSGTGLGLFIVRTLAERLGGQVSYGALSPHGSRFEVTLQVPSPASRTTLAIGCPAAVGCDVGTAGI